MMVRFQILFSIDLDEKARLTRVAKAEDRLWAVASLLSMRKEGPLTVGS